MLIFLRSSNYHIDGRLHRYVELLKNKVNYDIIYWDRKNECDSSDRVKFSFSSIYGGGIKSLFGFLLWNIFIIKYLYVNRKNISYVHAINLDTIIPVLLMKPICGYKVIYDIYDSYADSHSYRGVLNYIVKKAEKLCCYFSDLIILPHRCRIKQSEINKMEDKVFIIENVPLFTEGKSDINPTNKKTLIYAGNLQKEIRGIENLIKVISDNNNYELIICGDGEIKQYCQSISDTVSNISYKGSVSYSDMIRIMSKSDIIVGMYYKTCPNHIYAAPNKYYEHLALGKPLLTTLNTPPGDDVLKYQTGWSIGEMVEDIEVLLAEINENDIIKYSQNAKRLWEEKYNNYYDKCMSDYILRLKGL